MDNTTEATQTTTCGWGYRFNGGDWKECGEPTDGGPLCEQHKQLSVEYDRLGLSGQ